MTKRQHYELALEAAHKAGCSRREAEVIATWITAETLDDAAAQLGVSQRAVLHHLRSARRRLNVAHNGELVWRIANPSIPEVSLRRAEALGLR